MKNVFGFEFSFGSCSQNLLQVKMEIGQIAQFNLLLLVHSLLNGFIFGAIL